MKTVITKKWASMKGNKNGLGHSVSKENRQKLSLSKKGELNPRWGKAPWNKGIKLSPELRKKLSDSHLGKMKGTSNPAWKGGITPIRTLIRETPAYKSWRNKIYLRDNYTCVLCNQKGGALHVDHFPVAFSVFLSEIKRVYGVEAIFEMAMKYPKLWDTRNGRTLCVSCHRKTPTYGNRLKSKPEKL